MISTTAPPKNDENPVSLLPRAEELDEVNHHNDQPEQLIYPPPPTAESLPRLIQLLFSLNGLSLAMESLSLMYIVNTRVAIPLPYLPTYGAIAFLPYSLKPMYGYLSQGIPRHLLFAGLLTANSLCIFATCLIPPGGVWLAFAVAFFRGVTDSWAELCLGLMLIDHARTQPGQYDTLASRFQSQAATARNIGAFFGSLVTCMLLVERQLFSPEQTQLSGAVANTLLVATGILQLVGAAVAHVFRNYFSASPSHSFAMVHQEEVAVDEETALRDDEDSQPSYSSYEDQNDADSLGTAASSTYSEPRQYHARRSNWILVCLLQIVIVLIAMRGPITEVTSHMLWNVLVISILLSIVFMVLAMYTNSWWQKSHRVGLFLILRHAIPSDSMLIASFFYTVFQSTPLLLQVLSLVGMVMSTASSWSYGKLWSRYSSGRSFMAVIAGTTLLASFVSLSNILVYKASASHWIFLIAVWVKVFTSFSGEWAFLPDVVLATTSVSLGKEDQPVTNLTEVLPQSPSSENEEETAKKIAVQYGTLVSCIDFGDQLGSLLAGPLVALLGISRENDFLHLDRLILLSFVFSVLSLGLLPLLRKQ